MTNQDIGAFLVLGDPWLLFFLFGIQTLRENSGVPGVLLKRRIPSDVFISFFFLILFWGDEEVFSLFEILLCDIYLRSFFVIYI